MKPDDPVQCHFCISGNPIQEQYFLIPIAGS